MQKGKINVTSENIFPIIKKFLYSEHEIFLRELISNAIDATQKLKALSSVGDFDGELGDLTVRVSLDKEAKTITVSDAGIGMSAEEIDKYINQIAFSGAEEFLEKYKNKVDAIIGHFGLGFYSSFIVSERVDIITKSFREDEKAVKWSCDGSPEFEITEVEKEQRGTDIVLYIDEASIEFLEDAKINELLTKYCKFLPIEIAFGTKKETKEGSEEETDVPVIINNTKPAWTQKPADLKEEDYNNFYRELYPMQFEEPLFNIHLNVDYPFNLTGILYFPRIKSNIEIQKNKIQLFCNQVFVTDSVEGIVPDFLTLLHGVLDSPDIPLNVSRSYLQTDANVKKIANHISKKVADKLNELFKEKRDDFEKKWDDLKLFISYGVLSDEKFYDRAKAFTLLKNTDGKYFTFEEYQTLVKENQTDRENNTVYLYATDADAQYSFIDAAKAKGYDVLMLGGQLDTHFINTVEPKLENIKFARVDADVVDKLIEKDKPEASTLKSEEKDQLRPVFRSQLPTKDNFVVVFENLAETDAPALITQAEFMRRMKDMSAMGGGGMGFYGQMPDSYNMVINENHRFVKQILSETDETIGTKVAEIRKEIEPLTTEKDQLVEAKKDIKEEEVPQADKDRLEEVEGKIREQEDKIEATLTEYGKDNKLVKQIIDLALLANNMLKGEDLSKFVKRSVELIK